MFVGRFGVQCSEYRLSNRSKKVINFYKGMKKIQMFCWIRSIQRDA